MKFTTWFRGRWRKVLGVFTRENVLTTGLADRAVGWTTRDEVGVKGVDVGVGAGGVTDGIAGTLTRGEEVGTVEP